MSSFKTINLSSDSQRQEEKEEEQTRELQVEQGFHLFEQALELQKQHKYQESEALYTQLFKFEVLKPRNGENLSPSIKSLRHLAFKNRGVLKLALLGSTNVRTHSEKHDESQQDGDEIEEISESGEEKTEEDFKEEEEKRLVDTLKETLDLLLGALDYTDSPDDDLTNYLYELFLYFDNLRLAKAVLERKLLGSREELAMFEGIVPPSLRKTITKLKKIGHEKHSVTYFNCFNPLKEKAARSRAQNRTEIGVIVAQFHKDTAFSLLEAVERLYDNNNRLSKAVYTCSGYNSQYQCYLDPLLSSDYDTFDRISLEMSENQEVNDIKPMEIEDTVRAPMRSSKRVREDNTEVITNKFGDLHLALPKFEIEYVNGLLGLPCDNFKTLINYYVDEQREKPSNPFESLICDFNYCFKNWDKQKSGAFLNSSHDKVSMTDILEKSGKSKSTSPAAGIEAPVKSLLESSIVKIIVENVNNLSFDCNLYQLRYFALVTILSITEPEGKNLLISASVDHVDSFLLYLRKYIDYYHHVLKGSMNKLIYEDARNSKTETDKETLKKAALVSVTIVEILIEYMLSNPQKQDKCPSLLEKVCGWIVTAQELLELCEEDLVWFRLHWAVVLFKKQYIASSSNPHSILLLTEKEALNKMISRMEVKEVQISYPNYKSFPLLCLESLKDLHVRVNVLESLSKVLSNESSEPGYSQETIEFLEVMVQPETPADLNTDHLAVREFVQSSSFEVQLQLKNILLDHYFDENKSLFFASFRNLANDIVKFLASDRYLTLSETNRAALLLNVLKYYGNILEKAVGMIEESGWNFNETVSDEDFLSSFQILAIVLIFYLNRVASRSQQSNFMSNFPKAANRFTDYIVNSYILTFTYFKASYIRKVGETKESEKAVVEAISNIHALLGFCGICDGSSGRFLRLTKKELFSAKTADVDLEIFQLFRCLYGLPLTLEYFVAYNHGSKKVTLSREDALLFSKPFLKLAYAKRDPYFTNVKSDLKAILDAIYEAVGEPDIKYERFVRADALLETYLSGSLTTKLLREAFYGLLNVPISKSRLDFQTAVDDGLYYVQGVAALVLFKIRKRTMQGRSAELDFVMKMFKADLMCGTNRLESWLLLGQSYGFLVEDDLIWTSDKLNSDRKNTTAILQKRALLCYLMAVSIYSQKTDEQKKAMTKISSLLWSQFAMELYNSTMKPMEKLCYRLLTTPRLVLKGSEIEEAYYETPISDKLLYKTNLMAFEMSSKLDPDQWMNYLYISKLQGKLGSPCEVVLRSLLKSCELASTTGSDPVFEPHYRLCCVVYKYFKKQSLTEIEALQWLEKDSVFSESQSEISALEQVSEIERPVKFAESIIEAQRKLLAQDKKKWLHRPRYRISKILADDLNNLEAAKQEMCHIVSLKQSNKNLVTIWKSPYERPGKHFIYAFEYIKFYISLLERSNAFSTLCALLKKLRRFGSGMVNMVEAWEIGCHSACNLIKKILNISKTYTDISISKLVYKDFIEMSQELLSSLQKEGVNFIGKRLLFLLYEVSEIRRMNNGFASTAEIDDSFVAVYFTIYDKYMAKYHPDFVCSTATPTVAHFVNTGDPKSPTSPASKTVHVKTKVARRDVYPRAIAIMKMLQSSIEHIQDSGEMMFDQEVKFRENEIVEVDEVHEKEKKVEKVKKDEVKDKTEAEKNDAEDKEAEDKEAEDKEAEDKEIEELEVDEKEDEKEEEKTEKGVERKESKGVEKKEEEKKEEEKKEEEKKEEKENKLEVNRENEETKEKEERHIEESNLVHIVDVDDDYEDEEQDEDNSNNNNRSFFYSSSITVPISMQDHQAIRDNAKRKADEAAQEAQETTKKQKIDDPVQIIDVDDD